jgi:hypothetical protein
MLTSDKTLSKRAKEDRIVHHIRNDDFWRKVREALQARLVNMSPQPGTKKPISHYHWRD